MRVLTPDFIGFLGAESVSPRCPCPFPEKALSMTAQFSFAFAAPACVLILARATILTLANDAAASVKAREAALGAKGRLRIAGRLLELATAARIATAGSFSRYWHAYLPLSASLALTRFKIAA
jgi:hypothetical protein